MPRIEDNAAAGGLLEVLKDRIRRDGPMPVDVFMRACLDDPVHGYWRRAQTIGRSGDFITSPEISQVFGELIGLWCAAIWQQMGKPETLHLVELGPGLGTLMRDALRAARALPAFAAAIRVHLVEMSPAMRARQAATLADCTHQIAWHDDVREVPAGAAIVVGNEFLDALPIRQLVYSSGGWHERVVGLAPDGGLRFDAGDAVDGGADAQDGAILELRPGEDDVLAALASRDEPLAGLFIDYGPADAGLGDTLQAVRHHVYADPLAHPGTADITAHVQFATFAGKAQDSGLAADGPLTQAEFLGRLGVAERARKLMSANPQRAGEIEAAVLRLISPTGMGSLFKAMAVRSRSLPPLLPFG
jgi:NADH dehydrogenase [ubiquinone] 1 alpha subcomplex assembly factor 7